MNKLLIGAALVTTTAAAVTPAIISSKVSEQAQTLVDDLNSAPLYKAELSELTSGYLSTSGVLKVSLELDKIMPQTDATAPPLDDIEIEFNFHIDHGPILSSGTDLANIDITLNSEKYKSDLTWDHAKPLYQIKAQLGLNGALTYKDKSEKFQYKDGNGLNVDVASYQGSAQTVDGALVYKGILPSIDLNDPAIQLNVTDLVMDTHIYGSLSSMFSFENVPEYKASIALSKLTTNNINTAEKVNIEHLSMLVTSVLDKKKKLVSSEQIFKLGRFDAAEITGQDFELALEVNKLDETIYLALNKQFASPDASMQPEQQLATLGKLLEDNLLNILKPEPEFNIKRFKGTLPEGQFNGVLNAKIEKVTEAPAALNDPKFWLGHLNANSQIQIARPLFATFASKIIRGQLVNNPQLAGATPEEIDQITEQQTPQYIAMLETQGMIVPNEATDQYTVDFTLADRAAKLNGNDFPLPL